MQERNQPFDLDQVYEMMMDALDGRLPAEEWDRLHRVLEDQPALAAEWRAMQAVDALLVRTPLAQPSVNFADRTVARLPNWRVRRGVMAAAFVAMWSAGLLPVIFLAWFFGSELSLIANALWQISGAIAGAFGQLLLNFGRNLTGYPSLMGVLLVMIGSITLWSGVYQRLMMQPAATTH